MTKERAPYLVICKTDEPDSYYVVSTRQIFWHRDRAERYAATIHPCREPIVVEMNFPLRDATWEG